MSIDRILSQVLGSGAASGFAGGLAGGLAGNLLTSRSGRKLGKKALQVGGIAAVGGLAYAAWSRYGKGQDGAGVGRLAGGNAGSGETRATRAELSRFVPETSGSAEALGVTLLRAMVAAAQADGRLDAGERHAIYEHVGSLDLSEPEKAELLAQLAHPVDMSTLVAAATTPEVAAEIYTASLLAIELDTPAERAYLAMLAARLGLPEGLVESVHRELALTDANAATRQPQAVAS